METSTSWKLASPFDSAMNIGPQGQRLIPLINRELAGSGRISEGIVVMPPGGASHAHVHNHNEMIVGTVEGAAVTLLGAELTPVIHRPFERLWIGAGVPHVAVNLSMTHPVVALECRSDPEFNADVELAPEMDELAGERVAELRARYADEPDATVLSADSLSALVSLGGVDTDW